MTPTAGMHPSNPAAPQAVIIGLIIASLFAPIDVTAEDGRQVLALASLSGQVRCRSCTARGNGTVHYQLPAVLAVQATWLAVRLLSHCCRPWQ